ncbi:MAG: 3'-5' exonuclease [Burkholderiaceae bacterium]|nr:3'-5' exonuclease [Burkholderiaceae bacterium]
MWTLSLSRKSAPADPERWLVLDVESSGLDASSDRLLALAAVAVRLDGKRLWIDLADSFEAVLRQPAGAGPPDKSNILVHGIGVGAQGRGDDPAQTMNRFETFAGASPLLGFHVEFDRRLIDRTTQAVIGRKLRNPWLDIADVAAVLRPGPRARTLDDWLDASGIDCSQRHQASADTLATAELLLHLWPAARAEGVAGFRGLSRLAARRRWLS